jgi:hypothetical protein
MKGRHRSKIERAVPLESVFKDEQGREVRLGDFFKRQAGRAAPRLLLVPMLCNQVLNGMLSRLPTSDLQSRRTV